MIDLSPEILTAIMLGGIVVGVLTGFPVGFVIGAIGLIVGYVVFGDIIGQVLYDRAVDLMINYILLAVPLFIFMGTMLEYSGIAEKMFDALYVWFGSIRGGLAVTTVLIGTIVAATVGIVAASVTMLTLVAMPTMVKRGYSKSLASGSVCAGGCLGILIPPSVMLVLYGPMANISVGKLFFGAFIPGFMLSGLYCTYILIHSYLQPKIAPAIPPELMPKISYWKKTVNLLVAVAPTGVLIMSVLGVIFMGVAPPSEAAGMGAFVATLLTIAYGRFNLKVLKDVSLSTLRSSGFIFLLLAAAVAFVGVFVRGGGDEVVEKLIVGVPGGRWGSFAVVMFIIFILGFIIDPLAIIFIMVPIITPIAATLEFNTLWFAMMVCVNFQMAFMTPPFAMAIFVVRGSVAPELGVTMGDIIRGVIPFVFLIMIGLGLLVIFPELILWLPGQMIK
ncbi:MAG: TRAP transporter large permease subunit [Dehalococcoidales bacterium]